MILDDWDKPLDQVRCSWVRIPIGLLLFIFLIIPIGIVLGAIDYLNTAIRDFLIPVLRGPK